MKTTHFKGGRPHCPNHGEPLEGLGFPMREKGHGVCPVSKVTFAYEMEIDESLIKKDKFGKIIKDIGWKITGDDNK